VPKSGLAKPGMSKLAHYTNPNFYPNPRPIPITNPQSLTLTLTLTLTLFPKPKPISLFPVCVGLGFVGSRRFVVLCRDTESSFSTSDILEYLGLVTELSSGFDTLTCVSISSQSASAVSRTGTSIFALSPIC